MIMERKSPYGLSLPEKFNLVLAEKDIGSRELLIVGDVHGCYDELKEMMDTYNITNKNTCVVFVGDLLNKGPKSYEVAKCVMDNGWYSVRGNHDEIALKQWKESEFNKTEPVKEKFKWVTRLTQDPELTEWLYKLPYTIHIPSRKIIVVHAGLVPGIPLVEQEPEVCLHMRCVKNDGSNQWTVRFCEEEGYALWGSVWPGPEHVYFGHDGRRMFQDHKFTTGLDTGCVYGGRLTGIYPSNGTLIEIKSHMTQNEAKMTPRSPT